MVQRYRAWYGFALALAISIAAWDTASLWALGGQSFASSGETQIPGLSNEIPVFNGDFEAESPSKPPPGWSIWGPPSTKNPEHFVRDLENPHTGRACLRIFHPAGSNDYVVTDPTHAIRPQPRRKYQISFWVRADQSRQAVFAIHAYRSVRPLKDAPSPGRFILEVQPTWKPFSFEFEEGLDFFADESPYWLLGFEAVRDRRQQGTLWVDDIRVTSYPSTTPPLLRLSEVDYKPLNHRLTPGHSLDLTIDFARRWGKANRQISGISFHRVAGWTGQPFDRQGRFTLPESLHRAIRELRLPMTRFYAVGAEPFSVGESLDKIAWLCEGLGIPREWTVIELEEQSADSKLPPEDWARAVRHSLEKGYGFRFWEIANEPYMGKAFPTPTDYVEHFQRVSQAIREVAPEHQVGIAIHPQNVRWGNLVLKLAAGRYDFVVGHYYADAWIFRQPFEEVVITENMRVLDHILRLNAVIRAYNPGREVYQLDTEWGLHASGPNGERADYVNRNANVWGLLHRAIRMIYYAREGMLHGASSWQMLSRVSGQGFAILFSDAPESRSMLYWLYWHFNRHLGTELVSFEGMAPFHTPASSEDRALAGPLTPVLVTADGSQLFAVIANGSWQQSVPMRIRFRDFRPGSVRGVILSDDQLDGEPKLDRQQPFVRVFSPEITGGELRGKIPPHCVIFLTINPAPTG